MPDHLDRYAQDVQEMEARLLLAKSPPPTAAAAIRVAPARRSLDDSFEAEPDDFFIAFDDDVDFDEQESQQSQAPNSFLPGFLDNCAGVLKAPRELRLSERIPSVDTVCEVVEEKETDDIIEPVDTEQRYQQSLEEQRQRKNAQAAVAAMSNIFALPDERRLMERTQAGSPISVAGLAPSRKQSTPSHNTKSRPFPPPSQQQQQPHTTTSSTSQSAATTPERRSFFSGFVDHLAGTRDEPKEGNASSSLFTRFTKGSRTLSLPTDSSTAAPRGHLPRRSSLKRVSSLLKSNNNNQSASSSSLKRNVSFGKLHAREYNICLSDHPSCSYGPPIQLGWDYREQQAVCLNQYEEQRTPRRAMHQMVLSYNVRRYLLLKRAGYSDQELQDAEQEVDRVKRERMVTDLFLPVCKLDETMEEVIDQLKSSIFGGPRSL